MTLRHESSLLTSGQTSYFKTFNFKSDIASHYEALTGPHCCVSLL